MPVVYALIFLLMAQGIGHAATDEIDAWVRGFNPLNLNGVTPAFDLPEDTPPEKVVEALAQTEKKSDPTGQFHNYQILETKKIEEPNSTLPGYTVVLITSDKGSKTMIVLRWAHQLGWYARAFYITTVP